MNITPLNDFLKNEKKEDNVTNLHDFFNTKKEIVKLYTDEEVKSLKNESTLRKTISPNNEPVSLETPAPEKILLDETVSLEQIETRTILNSADLDNVRISDTNIFDSQTINVPSFNKPAHINDNLEELSASVSGLKESKKRQFKTVLLSVFFILLFLVSLVLSFFAYIKVKELNKPYIKLTQNEITINYGDQIDFSQYIAETNVTDEVHIAPFNSSQLGTHVLLFSGAKGDIKINEKLTVHIVDNEAPTFNLTTDEIHIKKSKLKKLNYISYIDEDSYSDNCDAKENLDLIVSCPDLEKIENNTFEITYRLSDKSNNIATKVLTVYIEK